MRIGILILVFLFFLSPGLWSQVWVKGQVSDQQTGDPLAYAHLRVQNGTNACVSNAEGSFALLCFPQRDSILVTYLGYESKLVAASQFAENPQLSLVPIDYSLNEVIVGKDNGKVLRIIDACRKNLGQKTGYHKSKAYFAVESDYGGVPLEVLEVYYNAYIRNITIESLVYKNGRVALQPIDNYFLSLHTSEAIKQNHWMEKNVYFPYNPLQLSKKENNKQFDFLILPRHDSLWIIEYVPKQDLRNYFQGELWVNPTNNQVYKLLQEIDSASVFPLIPVHDFDSIFFPCMRLETYFEWNNEQPKFLLTSFELEFDYLSHRDSLSPIRPLHYKTIQRRIRSKGVLSCFDYTSQFLEPTLQYSDKLYDYYKMTLIPYNEDFWKYHQHRTLSERELESLHFLTKNEDQADTLDLKAEGFDNRIRFSSELPDNLLFANPYWFWTRDKRIRIDPNSKVRKSSPNGFPQVHSIYDLFHFEVQILVDINPTPYGWSTKSYTLFDSDKTFFHLPVEPIHDALINMYFDLYEMNRLNFEAKLTQMDLSEKEIMILYEETLKNADATTRKFLFEVQMGENQRAMDKWNHRIFEALEIDNLKLFQEKE